jgi:Heterokaryon incompatibility protein Het-C
MKIRFRAGLNLRSISYSVLGFFLMSFALAQSPDATNDTWRGTDFDLATQVSLSGDKPFSTSGHLKLNPTEMACSEELNKAIYQQDILHQSESRAHFDNCDFDGALGYIEQLLRSIDQLLAADSKLTGPENVSRNKISQAMFALGQISHALQDFYAHSNYVEIMEFRRTNIKNEKNIPIVKVWESSARNEIASLISEGLVSGRVWWGFPKKCASTVPTHGDLAKDSPASPAGARTTRWMGRTSFDIAFALAQKSTAALLVYASRRWPAVRRKCGDTLAFESVQDHRKTENGSNK